MYDRIQGVLPVAVTEGTHFRVPWLQSPAVMDIRTRPRSISSVTGTKGRPAEKPWRMLQSTEGQHTEELHH